MSRRIAFISLSSYGYFVTQSPANWGGAERQLYLLSQQLCDDFDIHFLVGDYGQQRTERVDGITLHRTYEPDDNSTIPSSVRKSVKMASAIHRVDADLYVHRGQPKQAAVFHLLVEATGEDWLYHVANDSYLERNPEHLNSVFRRLYRRSLQSASAVVCQTDRQSKLLDERFDVEGEVVPNGYPTASEITHHVDREFVLWVGRFDPDQKRPHLFLELADRIPDEQFVVVGGADLDNAYWSQMVDRARQLENVNIIGRVSPDAIHEYYSSAKILVNTSAYEGFPNTFLEAWRVETPVVSLDIDIGRYGNLGSYAEGNFDELVSLTDKLCRDPEIRKQRGEESRAVFEENYSIESVATRYRRILNKFTRA